MKFPKNLYQGYQNINKSALVQNKDYSPEALSEFENILNGCQPLAENNERFETVKDIYNSTRFRYQQLIRGTPIECTILWTESKSIVSWFNLRGIIYLNYDHGKSKYRVQLHRNLDPNAPAIPQQQTFERRPFNRFNDRPQQFNRNTRAATEQKQSSSMDLGLGEFPTLNVKPSTNAAPVINSFVSAGNYDALLTVEDDIEQFSGEDDDETIIIL